MRRFYRSSAALRPIIQSMNPDKDRTGGIVRVLSLALPESQWRALLDAEPEPIEWLRQQIRERLHEEGSAEEPEFTTAPGLYASGEMS